MYKIVILFVNMLPDEPTVFSLIEALGAKAEVRVASIFHQMQ